MSSERFSLPQVIKSISGYKVEKFDPIKNQEILKLLRNTAKEVGKKIRSREGIKAPRPNEAGSRIEPFVRDTLRRKGCRANIPITKSGKRKKAGYPNLELTYKDWSGYLDCKTYASGQEGSSLRTFYLSPSEDPKITRTTSHLLLSFELEEIKGNYFPKSWQLYDLYNLEVRLKQEYNASNQDIYRKELLIDKEQL